MTSVQFEIFRHTLKCLPYHGISLIQFAKRIHLSPHTIYNYINGQPPSEKCYNYILYIIRKDHYEVYEEGKEIAQKALLNELGGLENEI